VVVIGAEKGTEELAERFRYGNDFGPLEDLERKKCPYFSARIQLDQQGVRTDH
jgi:hypothetical protein